MPPWESVFPALRDAPRALLEDGLAMEDCVGSRLGPGSAMGAFELSPGINETGLLPGAVLKTASDSNQKLSQAVS